MGLQKPKDDFETARDIIQLLEPFDQGKRLRILRWTAQEFRMQITLIPYSLNALEGTEE